MEHRTISLADQVFDRLEKEILTGKYQRGEILTEVGLCTDLGVSRTPIREALRRLEQEHIVEMSGKGIVVLGVTNEDLVDIYAIRAKIEGLAAALAAKNATAEQIEELKEAVDLQEFYMTKKDPDHIKAMDSRFHELIYRFSGSAVFYDTLMPLHKKTQKYRKASVENSTRASHSVAEHRAILEAVMAHDEAAAEAAMNAHVENAKNHIMRG